LVKDEEEQIEMIYSIKNRGFTLVELLVALAISSIIMAIIYATYQAQLRTQLTQQQVVEMQQNARAAMFAIEREIRLAGYDPTDSGFPQITSAQTGSITFTMDINNGADDDLDGIVDELDERGMPNVDGDINDNLEQITYRLSNDAGGDGIADGLDCNLQRQHWDGAAMQSSDISLNIDVLNFAYLDAGGNNLVVGSAVPAGQLADIRSIQISIVARAGENPRYGLPNQNLDDKDYMNQQGAVILPAQNDNFRRIVLSADVLCRNLGS
jgi:type IV pilus assembly protein PilW